VEKFVGDAVMVLFGVPKAHEDDPIRAIKVAREIHELVDALSPEVEKRIERPISMHTGINTGLVVTGEVDMERGTHGVAGDTINVASRLSSLAKKGEILVSPNTYRQAERHFTFESLGPTKVKGKVELIQVYKLLSAKQKPVTVHRLSGLRAELIGRKVEMAQLGEAVEKLRDGKSSIFSICGDAGTGKSRLVDEFRATLDLEEIQWLEGHAYAYSQNIPYFPLIDLLNRVFQIEEGDLPGIFHAERYLHHQYRLNLKASTLQASTSLLVSFLGFLRAHGTTHLETLTREDLEAFIEHLQDLGLKATTVSLRVKQLKALMRFLIEEEVVKPQVLLKRLTVKVPEPLPRAIPPDELRSLLAVIDELRNRAMILLLLRTGMRIRELLTTTINEVLIEEQRILIFEAEKNRLGRVVYFSDDASDALTAWLRERDPQKPYLFYARGKGTMSYTTARTMFHRYLIKAGLGHRGYTLHALRHTFATELLNAGMRLECLQVLLGHASLQMTRRYARLTDKTREGVL
jgi:integrase/recombinase XerD